MIGTLVITGDESHLPPITADRQLLLGDWWHASEESQLAGLLSTSFKWVGEPQSILVNGRGHFDCQALSSIHEQKSCLDKFSETQPEYIDVLPNSTYRLRIVGGSSLSILNVGIDAHAFTVVATETTLLQPIHTKYLDVAPGQSFSVILRTKTEEELEHMKDSNGTYSYIFSLGLF